MKELFDKLQWLALFGFGTPLVFATVTGIIYLAIEASQETKILIGLSFLLGIVGMVGVWGKKRYG